MSASPTCVRQGCGHPLSEHEWLACNAADPTQATARCDCPEFLLPSTPRETPRRTIRIADDLWNAAAAKADERGESVSDVVRQALERYTNEQAMADGLPALRTRILKELGNEGPELGDEDIAWILAPLIRQYAEEKLQAIAIELGAIGYKSAASIVKARK